MWLSKSSLQHTDTHNLLDLNRIMHLSLTEYQPYISSVLLHESAFEKSLALVLLLTLSKLTESSTHHRKHLYPFQISHFRRTIS